MAAAVLQRRRSRAIHRLSISPQPHHGKLASAEKPEVHGLPSVHRFPDPYANDPEQATMSHTMLVALRRARRTCSVRRTLHPTAYDIENRSPMEKLQADALKPSPYELGAVKTLDQILSERQAAINLVGGNILSDGAQKRPSPPIPDLLHKMIDEMNHVPWLPEEEREHFRNVFVSEMSLQFTNLGNFLSSQFCAEKNRAVTVRILGQIAYTRDVLLEQCRRKLAKLEQIGVLQRDLNCTRVLGFFQRQLQKRIRADQILENAIAEVEHGIAAPQMANASRQDPIVLGVQELNSGLSCAIKLLAEPLKPPVVSQKHAASLLRRQVERKVKPLTPAAASHASGGLHPSSRWSGKNDARRRLSSHWTSDAVDDGEHNREEGALFDAESEISESDGGERALEEDEEALEYSATCNPLLQAHSELVSFRSVRGGQMVHDKRPAKRRERYLWKSGIRECHWSNFDYATLDSMPLGDDDMEEDLKLHLDPAFQKETTGADYRPKSTKTSERVPQGSILLEIDEQSAAGMLYSGVHVDDAQFANLDEKLTRYKEVEELYEEIMRSIAGDHLNLIDDCGGCAVAPLPDQAVPISRAFQMLGPVRVKPTKREEKVHEGLTDEEQRRLRPRTPHTVNVSADEFARNRAAAMCKTPSSKITSLKYNYAGYVPPEATANMRKPKEKFNFMDYIDFLQDRLSDHVLELIKPSDRLEQERLEQLRIEDEERAAEEERMRIERAMREKKAKKERMLNYKHGYWNANILEYMAEMHDKSLPVLKVPEEAKEDRQFKELLNKGSEEEPPPPLVKSMSRIDIGEMQHRLERIWMTLDMPESQRMEIAIKYGSHQFAPKLEGVIELWEAAADHIEKREDLLPLLEEFEWRASDPARFFQAGHAASSELRFREAQERAELIRQLEEHQAEIEKYAALIKRETDDVVTYEGEDYVEKMSKDYSNMLYWLSELRGVEWQRTPTDGPKELPNVVPTTDKKQRLQDAARAQREAARSIARGIRLERAFESHKKGRSRTASGPP